MKCKYRMRWFSSKGAILVLVWTLLISFVSTSLMYFCGTAVGISHDPSTPSNNLIYIPILVIVLSAPLCGWLADAKFGNYEVFRVGIIVLFISTVLNCLLLVLKELVSDSDIVIRWIYFCLSSSLFVVGSCACVVTSLPLGLDQMPDASSSSLASYISWYVCSIYIGSLLCETLNLHHSKCLDVAMASNYSLIWALCLTVCMSIVVVLNLFVGSKWLIFEPESPQSLKIIYQVLKFAAKHKAPFNRSALTYWEEDIPSRVLDLGNCMFEKLVTRKANYAAFSERCLLITSSFKVCIYYVWVLTMTNIFYYSPT